MKYRTGYLFLRGKNWHLQWRVGGKLFSRSLRTPERRQAEIEREKIMDGLRTADEAAVLERYVARLQFVRAQVGMVPVADAWRKFVDSPARPDSGPSTLKQYSAEWRRFALWLAQHCPDVKSLAAVGDRQAQAYASTFAGAAGSTFNQHIGLLALMWRVLQVPSSPWGGIRRRRAAATGRRELTVDELRAICAAAPGELRTLFALGIYTGMRLGDCCLLHWGEVDLVRGMIRRIPLKTARRSGRPVIIPIHPALRAVLGASRRAGFIMPGLAKIYQRDRAELSHQVGKVFQAAGIETGTPEPGRRTAVVVGFHSLRHTFVSMCRAAGAPLAVVESLVGHSSPAMTRHYTHTGEDAAAAAVGLLPEIT